jgi:hypothetical protein
MVRAALDSSLDQRRQILRGGRQYLNPLTPQAANYFMLAKILIHYEINGSDFCPAQDFDNSVEDGLSENFEQGRRFRRKGRQ